MKISRVVPAILCLVISTVSLADGSPHKLVCAINSINGLTSPLIAIANNIGIPSLSKETDGVYDYVANVSDSAATLTVTKANTGTEVIQLLSDFAPDHGQAATNLSVPALGFSVKCTLRALTN